MYQHQVGARVNIRHFLVWLNIAEEPDVRETPCDTEIRTPLVLRAGTREGEKDLVVIAE
jgi:hypothetical protein